jgi:hypothetical protein
MLSPLSEELLNICDGTNNVGDIASQSLLQNAQMDGNPEKLSRLWFIVTNGCLITLQCDYINIEL